MFVCLFEEEEEEEEEDSKTEAVAYLPVCRYRTAFPVMSAGTWKVNGREKMILQKTYHIHETPPKTPSNFAENRLFPHTFSGICWPAM